MATTTIASVGAARCLYIQGPQLRPLSQPQLQLRSRKKASGRARAVSEIVEASQSAQVAPELTWQIWAGAIENMNLERVILKKPGVIGFVYYHDAEEEKVRTYKQNMLGCGSAGVTPFVVAGIEFSKRIAAQQQCSVCGGSGLVKKSGSYFRCGNCGGFLPWYSWRRFFKG